MAIAEKYVRGKLRKVQERSHRLVGRTEVKIRTLKLMLVLTTGSGQQGLENRESKGTDCIYKVLATFLKIGCGARQGSAYTFQVSAKD